MDWFVSEEVGGDGEGVMDKGKSRFCCVWYVRSPCLLLRCCAVLGWAVLCCVSACLSVCAFV